MRIISWNINGLRSLHRKGFFNTLSEIDVDIACLQEVKADPETLPPELLMSSLFSSFPHYAYFSSADKKGYSGVAVYTKVKPLQVSKSIGFERFDREGRVLKLDFPEFTLFNLYMPHGGRKKEALQYKLNAYKWLISYLGQSDSTKIILAGDFNIAHQDLDLARPKQNRDNIMFTPEERHQLDRIIKMGFVDTFRMMHPQEKGHYTWWPYGSSARQKNLGWRIDYIFISTSLINRLKGAFILPHVHGSDHCPVLVELTN